MRRALHLARRFFASLWPGPLRAGDVEWAESALTPDERSLWTQLRRADRRHTIAVARGVERSLAGTPHADDTRWMAAALLHDVGKLDADLGVFARVGATLAGAAAGHEMAEVWSTKRGITRRVGLYLRHPELGSTRILMAGGREEAAHWAAAHHSPDRWSALEFPPEVVAALHEADDD
jgi:hypothetical protein